MTSFDLMRAGWPNLLVLATLAVMPALALTIPSAPAPRAAELHVQLQDDDAEPPQAVILADAE